jgi:light-regulated signal transduction histidine kinase (bacteriophytochrome)
MPEIGWVAGATRPVSAALARANHSLWIAVGVNLAIVGVSLGVAALLGRHILSALKTLQGHAAAIGHGQLDQRVEVRGIDEFAELAESLNRMAQRLQDRTQTAENVMENLRRSNKELEQFAYVASHDLQEPLRVITGYLQLIERRYTEKLDDDGRQFIDYVVEAVNRMQQLISDLLQYSRVGSRGLPIKPSDMGAAVREALDALQKMIEETDAVVRCDPLPTVPADGRQLVQLFQNLIGNSIKFRSPERKPEIYVSARREDEGWKFSVGDNGIGIEPQYWEQIFVIFQRLHTRQKYPGTGIGLAVCKKIVERHGGRIWLDSRPGEGTTFHFTLG